MDCSLDIIVEATGVLNRAFEVSSAEAKYKSLFSIHLAEGEDRKWGQWA